MRGFRSRHTIGRWRCRRLRESGSKCDHWPSRDVKQVVFHKTVNVTLTAMGIKPKTYQALKRFRVGEEGNISELKRSFGALKA